MKRTNYFNVYKQGEDYYTKSLTTGESVYGEDVVDGVYREWIPHRSKLGAGIRKNLREFPFEEDSKVLYLGASSGTTCSHLSDVCTKGMVFGVEIAPRIFYKFVELAKKRRNLHPVLESAHHPAKYAFIPEVDVVFQDIAQKDQVRIFKKNCNVFLKNNGVGLLVVKARSINVTERPKEVFKQVRRELKEDFKILDERGLEPFEKDHRIFALKKK